ncbi:hypothetical protein A3Q56_00271 [Intoshia linei]|uniref:Condensin complex subunit 1 n=1 Tax=Intoshia linei TaxID=1819745 RepID=A0A177BCL7_9BILA|nr:hypothetical protein A3Q56_00271 [Intoshia linei]
MESLRMSCFETILNILKMPIKRLWSPPIVDEDLINVITESCYILIENMHKWKNKSSPSLLFQIIGICVKQYNHHILTSALKLIQLLKHLDDVGGTIADVVTMFNVELKLTLFIDTMMQELVNIFSSTEEANLDQANQATQRIMQPKGIPTFIVEVTMRNPAVMFKQLPILFQLRCVEYYTVRIAVLTAIGFLVFDYIPKIVNKGKSVDGCNKILEKCFFVLEEHVHDTNAFVRSKVVSIWQNVIAHDALPHSRQKTLLPLLIGRLYDKSTNVRKMVLSLFGDILKKNCISISLNFEELSNKCLEEKNKYKEMLKDMNINHSDGSDEEVETLENELINLEEILNAAVIDIDNIEKNGEIDYKTEQNSDVINSHLNNVDQEQEHSEEAMTKQKSLVEFMEGSIFFKKCIVNIIPIINEMLSSTVASLVVESLRFLVIAHDVGLQGIEKLLRQYQSLIMSDDGNVKMSTLDTFRAINLPSEQMNHVQRSEFVAKRLISLLDNANLGEYTALSLIVEKLVDSEDIDDQVIKQLWKIYIMVNSKNNDNVYNSSVKAMIILGMISHNMDILANNLDIMMHVGLSIDNASNDVNLAAQTCLTICNLSKTNKNITRFPFDHEIFNLIENITCDKIDDIEIENYNSFTRAAVVLVYKYSEKPDLRWENILQKLVNKMCGKSVDLNTHNEKKVNLNSEECNELEPKEISETPKKIDYIVKNINLVVLSRTIHIAGHVSVCQLSYLHEDIFSELKKRRCTRENNCSKDKTIDPDKTFGDEMGLGGAFADDEEYELIRSVTDDELLSDTHLLSFFSDLVKYICSNTTILPNIILQSNATLALTKFMLTSCNYCQDNLNLLFTILEKSKHANIKINIIIAIDDLCLQYPNLIDPYTPHIYYRLRDSSFEGNSVYNILPEIISRLSDESTGLSSDNFRKIIKYLFGLITKTRQFENLLEKLCSRFRTTNQMKSWRDIAFCLSLCTVSVKMLKVISDNFTSIGHTLTDTFILNVFNGIIQNARKTLKPEDKNHIDELRDKIKKVSLDEANESTNSEKKNSEESNKEISADICTVNNSATSSQDVKVDNKEISKILNGSVDNSGNDNSIKECESVRVYLSESDENESFVVLLNKQKTPRRRSSKRLSQMIQSQNSSIDEPMSQEPSLDL